MSDRFVYFYFMRSDPEQVRATVPENVSDWHGLALADYLGGPFEDRTGGLITFRADAAQQAVTDSPNRRGAEIWSVVLPARLVRSRARSGGSRARFAAALGVGRCALMPRMVK
jgi:hypothetical protein